MNAVHMSIGMCACLWGGSAFSQVFSTSTCQNVVGWKLDYSGCQSQIESVCWRCLSSIQHAAIENGAIWDLELVSWMAEREAEMCMHSCVPVAISYVFDLSFVDIEMVGCWEGAGVRTEDSYLSSVPYIHDWQSIHLWLFSCTNVGDLSCIKSLWGVGDVVVHNDSGRVYLSPKTAPPHCFCFLFHLSFLLLSILILLLMPQKFHFTGSTRNCMPWSMKVLWWNSWMDNVAVHSFGNNHAQGARPVSSY
jgi:hypothetical protein